MSNLPSFRYLCLAAVLLLSQIGCYAPMMSRAIPARQLPDIYRQPSRDINFPLNLSSLTESDVDPDTLRPGDLVEIKIPDLFTTSGVESIQSNISQAGEVYIPLAGPIKIGGLTFIQAHRAIEKAIGNDVLRSPRVSIRLVEKATIDVVVLGGVTNPGTYELPRNQADVPHAVAAAGGLSDLGSYQVEVHRKSHEIKSVGPTSLNEDALGLSLAECNVDLLDLRNCCTNASAGATRLSPGDAVYVRSRSNDVFYVVGKLDPDGRARFSVGTQDRDIGTGFLLPRDRDIDVVTAVAMAGYVDPIGSPTTVTVHRRLPNGESLLVKSNLMKARHDRRESVMIMPGDIVYLNPDPFWYVRYTVDRLLPDVVNISYRSILGLNQ